MRIIKKSLLAVFSLCLLLSAGCQKEELKMPGENSRNLMIVAHPDDETIFGGAHILDGDYFIVCLTNGNNRTRNREFHAMLEKTGNEGVILSYPDKTKGKRDNWEKVNEDIQNTVDSYINAKDWDMIVTHNPDGEYGHIHHKMTNQIVTSICEEENFMDELYYFAPYYKKKDLKNHDLESVDEEKLKEKEELASLYTSQEKVCKKLAHIFPYEKWTPAK